MPAPGLPEGSASDPRRSALPETPLGRPSPSTAPAPADAEPDRPVWGSRPRDPARRPPPSRERAREAGRGGCCCRRPRAGPGSRRAPSPPLPSPGAAADLTHLVRRRGARLGGERAAGLGPGPGGRRGAGPALPAPPSRSQGRGEPCLSRHRGYSILHRERRPLPHARLQPTAAR